MLLQLAGVEQPFYELTPEEAADIDASMAEAERDVPELHLCGRAHRMATQTMTQSTALTAQAAPSRAATGMRRIDHAAGCAGCGAAGPWAWAWACT